VTADFIDEELKRLRVVLTERHALEAAMRRLALKDEEIADFEREAKRYRGELQIAKAEIATTTKQRDELRRQNAEKADLLDRCIALFRKNGDYPSLTQEIVAALTSAPQAALDTESPPLYRRARKS
jgi:septal ring factor EnvC (AmiA/AmiB activator)